MPKSPTAFYQPQTLPEALSLLAQPDVLPLGGGTKLLRKDVPGAVVDLQKLGLKEMAMENGRLVIGALLPLAEMDGALTAYGAETPAALLRQAISLAGPNTYRNAATLGGTIASRLEESELLAALLALQASITLYVPEQKEMALEEYLAAAERPSGLITAVAIPWGAGRGALERVARTPRDAPIVSVVMWQPENEPPRLAAVGCGQRPLRLRAAEQHLQAHLTPEAIAQAAQAAQAAATHPGDFRGEATYRAEITAVLTRRVLG